MFVHVVSFLLLILTVKNAYQSCSSTIAITTCTWDTLKSPKPLQINGYKGYLSFSDGNLERIPNGVFKLLPQVTTLQLSRNKISVLEEASLEGLTHLKHLNLYDNKLTTINQNSLKHCVDLEVLNLGLNRISTIHDKAFEHLTSLKELNLAFNSLKKVPPAVNTLAKLEILKLSNNEIQKLKPNGFSKLSKLKELSISDNKLKKIDADAFKGLLKLNSLDLRSNYLVDLDSADIASDARALSVISLSINDFSCDKLRKIIESFRKYNVDVSRGFSKSTNNVNGIGCKI